MVKVPWKWVTRKKRNACIVLCVYDISEEKKTFKLAFPQYATKDGSKFKSNLACSSINLLRFKDVSSNSVLIGSTMQSAESLLFEMRNSSPLGIEIKRRNTLL